MNAIPGDQLRQPRLPAEVVLNHEAVGGDKLLLLEREQRRRSGWRAPTA